jgi:hypothetical protein
MDWQRFKSLALILLIASVFAGDPLFWHDTVQGVEKMTPFQNFDLQLRHQRPKPCCDLPQFQHSANVKIQPAVLSFRVNPSGRVLSNPMLNSPYGARLKHVVTRVPEVVRL